MKDELLGLNHLVSFAATCHTVSPRSSAVSSGHLSTAPPQSSSGMPRCSRYHAASAALSPVLLKNTPPIPVTFAIVPLLVSGRLALKLGPRARQKVIRRRGRRARHHGTARVRWPGC